MILKNVELNALPVYDDINIKSKSKTYSDKVYTNFHGLNIPDNDIDFYWFFTCTQKAWKYNNCAYKTANKQITDYLDNIFFKD